MAVPGVPLHRHGINVNNLFDNLAGARPICVYGRSSSVPVVEARAPLSVDREPELIADGIE